MCQVSRHPRHRSRKCTAGGGAGGGGGGARSAAGGCLCPGRSLGCACRCVPAGRTGRSPQISWGGRGSAGPPSCGGGRRSASEPAPPRSSPLPPSRVIKNKQPVASPSGERSARWGGFGAGLPRERVPGRLGRPRLASPFVVLFLCLLLFIYLPPPRDLPSRQPG